MDTNTVEKEVVYRQGDVALVRCAELPAKARKLDEPVILAHGEKTGHAHQIFDGFASLYEAGDSRYLAVTGSVATLQHQEHAAISIQPGVYEVRRQREYSPEEIRWVLD